MAANIFRYEFRMHLRSVLTWSAAIAALIFVFVSLFSSFSEDAALLNEMLDAFPPELLTAFGMTGVDLATILGYFSFAFLFVQLCLAIQAAGYGFSLVSIEEREWTADFLLAKPVSRTQILTSKLLAALSGLLITDIVVWAASLLFITLFKGAATYDSRTLWLLLLSIVPFQLFFLSVGLVISLLVKRIRNVTPYAMALGFGMYVLSVFGDMLGESVLEKITPFKHFASYIVAHGAYDLPLALQVFRCRRAAARIAAGRGFRGTVAGDHCGEPGGGLLGICAKRPVYLTRPRAFDTASIVCYSVGDLGYSSALTACLPSVGPWKHPSLGAPFSAWRARGG